jgi:hypothetical protein
MKLTITFLLLLGLCAAAYAQFEEPFEDENGFLYLFINPTQDGVYERNPKGAFGSNNEAAIVGYSGNAKDLTIPLKINETNDLSVIVEGAFKGKNLTSVNIPGGIILKAGAFESNHLVQIVIPSTEGIDTIEKNLFRSNNLATVIIPSNIRTIGEGAFAYQNNNSQRNKTLSSVTMFSGLAKINAEAFRENNLSLVHLPDTVTSVGARAFADNPVKTITIGSKVDLAADAFGYNFVSYYSANGKAAGTFVYDGNKWQPERDYLKARADIADAARKKTVSDALEIERIRAKAQYEAELANQRRAAADAEAAAERQRLAEERARRKKTREALGYLSVGAFANLQTEPLDYINIVPWASYSNSFSNISLNVHADSNYWDGEFQNVGLAESLKAYVGDHARLSFKLTNYNEFLIAEPLAEGQDGRGLLLPQVQLDFYGGSAHFAIAGGLPYYYSPETLSGWNYSVFWRLPRIESTWTYLEFNLTHNDIGLPEMNGDINGISNMNHQDYTFWANLNLFSVGGLSLGIDYLYRLTDFDALFDFDDLQERGIIGVNARLGIKKVALWGRMAMYKTLEEYAVTPTVGLDISF